MFLNLGVWGLLTLSFPPISRQTHDPTCACVAHTREELALSSASETRPVPSSSPPVPNLTLVGKQLLQTFQQMCPGDGSWDLAHSEWLLSQWPLQRTCNKQLPKPRSLRRGPEHQTGRGRPIFWVRVWKAGCSFLSCLGSPSTLASSVMSTLALPGGIHVQMGAGLHGRHARGSTHVHSSVPGCVTSTRPPEPWHEGAHGVPALMGAGLSSGRDTEEEKRLGCVSRALTPGRAGRASCTTLTLQCVVANTSCWQQLRRESEGQINLHGQAWMGHETLKRNVCTYNKGDGDTGRKPLCKCTRMLTQTEQRPNTASCAHPDVSSAQHGCAV